ncbi:MAG: YihY/virulence factor BrkB family protein [Gemmatimonadota bacterium]|nr:YihY/virulence factor BrkB family protein [Gemmatimonadota bacterium]
MGHVRPWYQRLGVGVADYVRRVWDNSGEDDIFFLAGGIAFNILIAIVPFLLLFATALSYLLNQSTQAASNEVVDLVSRFLPRTSGEPVIKVVGSIIAARGTVGLYAAIGFIWFSTRLFGSMRSILNEIFDIEVDRGIIDGKIYDVKVTIVSSLLFVAYTAVSAYIALATTRGVAVLAAVGLRKDVMGNVEYTLGRLLAFVFIGALFYGLYKYLPYKKMRWQTAFVACAFTAAMFEIAKTAFAYYATSFKPGSLYTGTIAALVVVVLWVYYASMVFILGGEVAQVYELRHVRRRQHEAFED